MGYSLVSALLQASYLLGEKKKVPLSPGTAFKQAQQVIKLNAAVYSSLHKCLNNIRIDPQSFSS